MGFWKSLAGVYTVEITSASPMDVLDSVNKQGIILWNITYLNELSVKADVYVSQFGLLCMHIKQSGDELSIIQRTGLFWPAISLLNRPVLIFGVLLYTFLSLFLPTRILFIQVDGNITIPDKLILEKAEECGIVFGASRREIRSEKTKNALLSSIPQLQWAGINTSGCVAVISVRERSVADTNEKVQGVSSIVALCDGIIQEMTVTRGTALCQVGQAVKKGQLLISGYTDCGIFVKAEQAQGEIVAQTQRILQCYSPSEFIRRLEQTKQENKFSLKIGKNIINLYKSSGILDSECVKMYVEIPLLLPGGFALPVSIIKESYVYYDYLSVRTSELADFNWTEDAAKEYLGKQMHVGSILNSVITSTLNDDYFSLYGHFSCKEMIGQIQNEELVKYNGKNG